MSGFLQRLLGQASGMSTGPVVRVQPVPAWPAPGLDGGVDDAVIDAGGAEGPRSPGGDRPPQVSGSLAHEPPAQAARRDAPAAAQPAATPARAGAATAPTPRSPVHPPASRAASAAAAVQAGAVALPARLQPPASFPTMDAAAAVEDAGDATPAASARRPPPLPLPLLPPLPSDLRMDAVPSPGLPPRHGARPAPVASAAAPAPEAVVHVTIGRIDLVAQAPAPRARPAAPRPKGTVPLSDYLRGAHGGRG